MYPRAFEYFAPSSIAETSALLTRYGEGAKIMAGGQSLIPLMKLRLASPAQVIDISRLPGLKQIDNTDSYLKIGALVTHANVLECATVRRRFPLMADAVGVIGDTQVRNWGTVGGAMAEADPAGDWGAVALALKGRLRCVSPRGERLLDAEDFFVDAYTTQLAADELITEIIFPVPEPSAAGVYVKLERRAGDFAVMSVAVQLTLENNSVCRDATVALAAAGLTPIQARFTAESLRGKELGGGIINDAARLLAGEVKPLADIRGTEEYKRAAAASLFKQAVEIALRRARGERVNAGHAR